MSYTDEQMETLTGMIRSIAEEEDAYYVDMDFDKIRTTFAEALVLLESDYAVENADLIDSNLISEPDQDDIDLDEDDENVDGDDAQDQCLGAAGWLLLAGVAAVGVGILVHRKLGSL